jgi:hypothetical protein
MTYLRTPNRGPRLASLPRLRRCHLLPQGEDRFVWLPGEIVLGPRRTQVARPEDLAEPLRGPIVEGAQ